MLMMEQSYSYFMIGRAVRNRNQNMEYFIVIAFNSNVIA